MGKAVRHWMEGLPDKDRIAPPHFEGAVGGFSGVDEMFKEYEALKKALKGIPGEDVVAQAEWVVAETAKARRQIEELQMELRETEGEIKEMKRIWIQA